MPTLDWIGKDKVVNHHLDVPYRILERKYSYDEKGQHSEDNGSENMIIHGDNLEALKSLLPKYEGKIDCIYIDPPYNTGNEGWVYNDNVNDPKIKKWLGQVVGQEGEDLSRHDKWLCMMYPRLKLLQKLLSDKGAIFISIDDNEQANLKLICDEIFGNQNFLGSIIRSTGTTTGQDSDGLGKSFDYIICYEKSYNFRVKGVSLSESDKERYNLQDEKGSFSILQLRRTGGEDRREDRPTMFFPIKAPDGTNVYPIGPSGYESRWRVGPETVKERLKNNELFFRKDNQGNWKVYYKYYLENKTKRPSNLWTEIDGNKKAQIELKQIFTQSIFDTPKPTGLIKQILEISTDKNSIILDSFAGSGTTAHAVFNLNKQDGGNRHFICIELMDYADTITAERVKRVINGYGEGSKAVEGTDGSFSFYELGSTIMNGEYLNEEVGVEKIRDYIYFTETKANLPEAKPDEPYYMGTFAGTAYYFNYQVGTPTTLSHSFLSQIKTRAESYVIYADLCTLSKTELEKFHIIFKKIPRDITRF